MNVTGFDLDGLLWPWPLISRIWSFHQWGIVNIPLSFNESVHEIIMVTRSV